MHGRRVHTWSDGRRYEGEYHRGRKVGRGVLTWPDGSVYDGMWKDGVQHGVGTYTDKDGEKLRGEWKHGVRGPLKKGSPPLLGSDVTGSTSVHFSRDLVTVLNEG